MSVYFHTHLCVCVHMCVYVCVCARVCQFNLELRADFQDTKKRPFHTCLCARVRRCGLHVHTCTRI